MSPTAPSTSLTARQSSVPCGASVSKKCLLAAALGSHYVVSGIALYTIVSEGESTWPSRRIGIIIGSTRPGRFADHPAEWIDEVAGARGEIEVEVARPARLSDAVLQRGGRRRPGVRRRTTVARRWQKKIASLDGFIVVAAEYNRGPTAVLKNALDYAYKRMEQEGRGLRRLWRRRRCPRGRAASAERDRAADGADSRRGPHPVARHVAVQQGKELEELAHLDKTGADSSTS